MILAVTFAKTTYNGLPNKFEAGTPNISGAVGLGAAVDFMLGPGPRRRARARIRPAAARHGRVEQASPSFASWARPATRPAWCPLPSPGVHPHDLGTILDEDGIAIRTGHHCAMPVMEFFQAAGNRARLVRLLQHLRGNRQTCRRRRARAQDVCLRSPKPMELNDLYRDVILDHNRRPRNFGALGTGRRQRRGIQSHVRRSTHGAPAIGRWHDQRHPVRGSGLRDFDRLGVADDRSGERQDPHPRRCSCSIEFTSFSPTMRRRPATNSASSPRYPVCANIRHASNARAFAGTRSPRRCAQPTRRSLPAVTTE